MIKKGDTVQIITGKNKGKSGKVLRVLSENEKVLVEGINVFKKHSRPKKQGEKGQIIEVTRPLSISNVMLFCSSCKKPRRVGIKMEGDKKVRVCKKCEAKI